MRDYYLDNKEKIPGYSLNKRQLPENSIYFRAYTAALSLINTKGSYFGYHLLNMMFSMIGFVVIYYLLYSHTKKIFLALLSVLFLVLCPRFFGDIPANPKDMPFAVMYLVSLAGIYLWSKCKDRNRYRLLEILSLGIVFGFSFGQRAVAATLVVLYVAWNLHLNKRNLKTLLINSFFILLTSHELLLLLWPFYKVSYPESILEILSSAKSYDFWDKEIIYMGRLITRYTRPWHYLFVWLGITTPLFILIGNFLGLIYFTKDRLIKLVTLALFLNFLLYLVLKPVLYNGLRHFLYIVPLMVVLSVLGYYNLLLSGVSKKIKICVFLCAFIFLLSTYLNVIKLYPFQYTYFNELVGGIKNANGKYEVEYYGSSYKEAAEWIVTNAKEPGTTVFSCRMPEAISYYSQNVFSVSDSPDTATYTICDPTIDYKRNLKGDIVFKVKRQNVVFNIVRRNK